MKKNSVIHRETAQAEGQAKQRKKVSAEENKEEA